MKIFQFKVSLDHVEPPVWRRFVISSDATFGELSDVIQIVMGWTNSHLHEFLLGAEHIGMKDEDSPAEVKNENRIRLSSKFKTEKMHFATSTILVMTGSTRSFWKRFQLVPTNRRAVSLAKETVHRKIVAARINTWRCSPFASIPNIRAGKKCRNFWPGSILNLTLSNSNT